jgi:hypothetical protein
MFLQIAPYSRRRGDNRNSMFLKYLFRANTGQHQNFWRCNRTGTQDYLAVTADGMAFTSPTVFRANRTMAVGQYPLNMCFCYDLEIRASSSRFEISFRGALSPPTTLIHLHSADARLSLAIVIPVENMTGLLRRHGKRIRQWMIDTHV